MNQRTLYSKQDTQIVRSSSSLLSCEGGMSAVQRWIKLLSAFFITHRKHTSRWRLVSAARVATDLPCWDEERRHFCYGEKQGSAPSQNHNRKRKGLCMYLLYVNSMFHQHLQGIKSK